MRIKYIISCAILIFVFTLIGCSENNKQNNVILELCDNVDYIKIKKVPIYATFERVAKCNVENETCLSYKNLSSYKIEEYQKIINYSNLYKFE